MGLTYQKRVLFMMNNLRMLLLLLPFLLGAQEWEVSVDEDAIKISIDGNIVAGDRQIFTYFPQRENHARLPILISVLIQWQIKL